MVLDTLPKKQRRMEKTRFSIFGDEHWPLPDLPELGDLLPKSPKPALSASAAGEFGISGVRPFGCPRHCDASMRASASGLDPPHFAAASRSETEQPAGWWTVARHAPSPRERGSRGDEAQDQNRRPRARPASRLAAPIVRSWLRLCSAGGTARLPCRLSRGFGLDLQLDDRIVDLVRPRHRHRSAHSRSAGISSLVARRLARCGAGVVGRGPRHILRGTARRSGPRATLERHACLGYSYLATGERVAFHERGRVLSEEAVTVRGPLSATNSEGARRCPVGRHRGSRCSPISSPGRR